MTGLIAVGWPRAAVIYNGVFDALLGLRMAWVLSKELHGRHTLVFVTHRLATAREAQPTGAADGADSSPPAGPASA